MSVLEGHSVARRDASRVSTVWTDAVSLIMPEPWVKDALCAQTDPELFFPEKGGSTKAAKKVCAACPVAEQCLDYALREGERIGIWGGRAPRERRRMAGFQPSQGESQEQMLRRLHGLGLMDVEIAPHLGVSAHWVGVLRKRHGLSRNASGGQRKKGAA